MNDDLTSYNGIRCAVLDAYYEGCRHSGATGRPHAEALGYTEYQFENVFEIAINDLMKDAVLLVLTGPWYQEVFDNIRRRVRDALLEPTVREQVAALAAEDREALVCDLAACGVALN